MIKKYQEYYQLIKEEAGIKNLKNTIKGYTEFEIYFHQDLDGVASALCMKKYIEDYGLKCVGAHIIQYGGLEYAVKRGREGVLMCLVDFAHGKPMFQIHTDHHEGQAGAGDTKSTSFKHARSNAETLSGVVPNSDIFDPKDIELIRTVDSADFHSKNITPEMVSNSIFKVSADKTATENRFLMGFVVNRLTLAYKNKRITVSSLDGKTDHANKNILECMVLDCKPSLYSMFNVIRHYIKTAKSHDRAGVLATQETIAKNLSNYTDRMKNYKDLTVDKDYGIAVQYGGGTMFDPGSYDRYTVFKNNPDILFNTVIWPMGLIQVSCNPFKEKELKNINLGEIAREVLNDKYKAPLSRIMVSVWDIKKQNEIDIEKRVKDEGGERIGFTFEDLSAFYNKVAKHQPNLDKGDKTVADFDLDAKDEYNTFLSSVMSKLHSDVSFSERKKLESIKISAWDVIMANSGGHPSITNISGITYLAYRKDGLQHYFKTDKFTDLMKMIQKDIVELLRTKIDEARSGQEQTSDAAWGNSAISEDNEFFVSRNGESIAVTKEDFIKLGADNGFKPKLNSDKGFSITHDGNKVIAKLDEKKRNK